MCFSLVGGFKYIGGFGLNWKLVKLVFGFYLFFLMWYIFKGFRYFSFLLFKFRNLWIYLVRNVYIFVVFYL